MKKNLSLVFLSLCFVWWGALAVLKVSGETASLNTWNGSLMGSDGAIVGTVVTTTTTTTTTIPPGPEDLVTNGNFATTNNWTDETVDEEFLPDGMITIYPGSSGYAKIFDTSHFGFPTMTPGMYQTVRVTNGWTYNGVFTLIESPNNLHYGVYLAVGYSNPYRDAPSPIIRDVGTYTQEIVCAGDNQNFTVCFYADQDFTEPPGVSVSNIHLYVVSPP